jgi:hypothetical protein
LQPKAKQQQQVGGKLGGGSISKGSSKLTEAIDLPDRDAAKIWIIRNQFGRRNLSPYTRAELALKLEPLIAPKAKEQQARKPESVSATLPKQKPIDTRAASAKSAGFVLLRLRGIL